jgi:hypothetical protein
MASSRSSGQYCWFFPVPWPIVQAPELVDCPQIVQQLVSVHWSVTPQLPFVCVAEHPRMSDRNSLMVGTRQPTPRALQ